MEILKILGRTEDSKVTKWKWQGANSSQSKEFYNLIPREVSLAWWQVHITTSAAGTEVQSLIKIVTTTKKLLPSAILKVTLEKSAIRILESEKVMNREGGREEGVLENSRWQLGQWKCGTNRWYRFQEKWLKMEEIISNCYFLTCEMRNWEGLLSTWEKWEKIQSMFKMIFY